MADRVRVRDSPVRFARLDMALLRLRDALARPADGADVLLDSATALADVRRLRMFSVDLHSASASAPRPARAPPPGPPPRSNPGLPSLRPRDLPCQCPPLYPLLFKSLHRRPFPGGLLPRPHPLTPPTHSLRRNLPPDKGPPSPPRTCLPAPDVFPAPVPAPSFMDFSRTTLLLPSLTAPDL